MSDLDCRRFLTNPLFDRPVIALYGSEDRFVDGAARSVVAAFRQHHSAEFQLQSLTGVDIADSPSLLIDFFSSASLFGEKRALWISGLTERHLKTVAAFADTIQPTNDLVLFSSPSLKKKSKTLDVLRNHALCRVISAYQSSLSASDIRDRFSLLSSSKLEIDAVDKLVGVSGTADALTFDTFLRQLALYSDAQKSIAADDVSAVLPAAYDADNADVLTALLSGDRAALLKTWERARLGNSDGTVFVLLLGNQIVSALSTVGLKSPPRAKLFWKLDAALTAANRRLPQLRQRLEEAASQLVKFEKRMRSNPATGANAGADDVERLLLRLSGLFQK